MGVSNKMHPAVSIIAAVILTLSTLGSTVLSLARSFASGSGPYNTLSMLPATIALLLIVVVLFRRKKDRPAGIMMILALALSIFNFGGNLISAGTMCITMDLGDTMILCYMLATLISAFASLVNAVFRAMAAAECFNPGKLSGGKGRFLLILLPIVYVLLNAISAGVQTLLTFGSVSLPVALASVFTLFFASLIGGAPHVLVGLAFSIPVREAAPAESVITEN